jgi:hypothetical protein
LEEVAVVEALEKQLMQDQLMEALAVVALLAFLL